MSSRIDLSNLNAPFFDRKKVKNGYGKRYTDRVIRVRQTLYRQSHQGTVNVIPTESSGYGKRYRKDCPLPEDVSLNILFILNKN